MLTNGNLDGLSRFIQQELVANPELFRQFDRNSDGKLTSPELPSFWRTIERFGQLDKDRDGEISSGETGEAFWSFVADIDQDRDGSIDRREYSRAWRAVRRESLNAALPPFRNARELQQQGYLEEAVEAYKKALEIAPANVSA